MTWTFGDEGGGMHIKRLQHISIEIEAGREDEARRFYGEALGLKEKRRPMGLRDRALIWFDVGDGEDEIHLIRMDRDAFTGPRREDHLCIEVDDIEAMRTHLRQQDVPVQETSVIDNRPRFFVTDPFGNRIELVQIVGKFTPVDE
jgi:catechol 2,3-dioxygenase-like lactoylglutathione lyase family enzyme